MSEPFLAEIMIVGFNFPPKGWAFCEGQIMPINQNQSLFSLLGTTYGGDGRSTFALPDLRGRTPIHKGEGHTLGQKGGTQTVTLDAAEIAAHTHAVKASSTEADNTVPTGRVLGAMDFYRDPGSNMTALRSGTVTNAGGGQAQVVENRERDVDLREGLVDAQRH